MYKLCFIPSASREVQTYYVDVRSEPDVHFRAVIAKVNLQILRFCIR